MPDAPNSAEFAARRARQGRVVLMNAPFWAMMVLAAVCLVAAVLVVTVAPRLLAPPAAPKAASLTGGPK